MSPDDLMNNNRKPSTSRGSQQVVLEGLDRPLLDDNGTPDASAGDESASVSLDVPRKSNRSVTRLRSQPFKDSSFRSHTSQGLGDDVAFKITVRSQSHAWELDPDGEGLNQPQVDIDVCHNTVAEAVQGAVENAVQEVVQDAVHGAVQDAVQQVMDDTRVKFDVRANFYTLIAITGVIIFWRGTWTTWDYFFGFSIWSELGAIATGLVIMITFRLMHVPLLDGLPSG